MCIIAVKPANQKVNRDTMANCFRSNPHGAGFAYINDNHVVIEKGFDDFDKLWERLNRIQEVNDQPMVIHFRIRSAGEINEFNTHPFQIDDQHAMAHNGTIQEFNAVGCKFSDTCLFNHNILKPLFQDFPTFYKTKHGRFLLEQTIRENNKIAILDADGSYLILNESSGEWVGGIWYSNKSYLPPPPPKKKKKKNR